jgi:TolB protein
VAPHLVFSFKGDRGGRSGLTLYDVTSQQTRPMAVAGPRDFYLRPAFAPDGSRLVAQRRTPPGKATRLWIVEAGRPPQPLPHRPGAFDMKARFSRDGSRILFTRRPSQRGPGNLFWLDPASGALEEVAPSSADDHSAWPSPTRDEISFISDREGTRDVFLLSDGGEPRNLTRTPDFDEAAPIWSPDGERLVVLRFPTREGPAVELDAATLRLVVLDRQGRTLFETPGQMADWMPAWPRARDAQPTQ